MKQEVQHAVTRIKEGMLTDMWKQTKWIYGYVKRYWKHIILYTLLGLVGTLVSLGASLISKDLVDVITGYKTGLLVQTFCTMIGLALGNMVLTQLSGYASSWISLKVDTEIKAEIFDKMLTTELESINHYHTGDLLTRWSSDASTVSSGVLSFIPQLIISIFQFLATLALVVYYDWTFALFAMIGVPFSILMSKTLMKRMVNNNKRSAAMSAKLSGFNQESFSNIQTIKAFDLIPLYVKRLKDLQKEYITMKMDFQKMSMFTSMLMATVGLLVSYSSYGWGIYRVWSGAISYGTMTMFLSMSGMLTTSLNSLISLVPTAIGLTTSAGRLMDILAMPRENYEDNEKAERFLETSRACGIGLTVQDLSYTYHQGSQVFCGASLSAEPHEVIALVGPSGEGKTTMLRLLLALLNPQEGSISYHSANTAEGLDSSPSVRKFYSYVPQGNTMFSGTIAENMRNVKPDATDEEIQEALRMACADSFVDQLPEGIYSTIQERGGGLSEGQAQRLSIARALLRQSPILLLDEATSALDVATERQVLRNIMADTYPRTCIVTTHRPTVLSSCNRVYAIRDKQCALLSQDEIKELIDLF